MEFRLLGPLEVVGDDGAPVAIGGRRPRALLTLLLLHPNEVVSTDRLIDGIWGERPPASAGGSTPGARAHAARRARRRAHGGARPRVPPPRRARRAGRGALPAARRHGGGSGIASRCARALARPRAGRRRATSPSPGSRAARLDDAAPRCARGPDPGRPRCGVATAALTAELEAHVATHPHRERLRAQQMARPLPGRPPGRRAGRLPDDARRRSEEFGVEPSRRAAGARAADPAVRTPSSRHRRVSDLELPEPAARSSAERSRSRPSPPPRAPGHAARDAHGHRRDGKTRLALAAGRRSETRRSSIWRRSRTPHSSSPAARPRTRPRGAPGKESPLDHRS